MLLHEVLIQEESISGILDYPCKPLAQVCAGHGTASHNLPPMRLDVVETKGLLNLLLGHGAGNIILVLKHQKARALKSLP